MWALLSLELERFIVANMDVSKKFKTRMANSIDPDDMACYGSHVDLHCLQMCLVWLQAEQIKTRLSSFDYGVVSKK